MIDQKIVGNYSLMLNVGSSSLKAVVFDDQGSEMVRVGISGIGYDESDMNVGGADEVLASSIRNHSQAVGKLKEILERENLVERIVLAGHRVVFAGGSVTSSVADVNDDLVLSIKRWSWYDQSHSMQTLEVIDSLMAELPNAKHVACFDSGFFVDLPEVAKVLPVPKEITDSGISKNGFHGFSYASVVSKLGDLNGKKVVIAHLGSGCSISAINDGKPIDTTMSFSPNSGVPMSTRSGDIDPLVVAFLVKDKGLSIDHASELLSRRSGILGISSKSADMKTLIDDSDENPDARLAVDKFCYEVKKTIGAYATVMGGIDLLVFTGGMGTQSEIVRNKICSGLEFLNNKLEIKVIEPNEELAMFKECKKAYN